MMPTRGQQSVHPDAFSARRNAGLASAPELTTHDESPRAAVLHVAALRLEGHPFAAVSLDDIAADVKLPRSGIKELFTDMHEIGAAVLDHERASMRAVQKRVLHEGVDPLEQLVLAFRLVGENLASDVVVRAGVRMAAESRAHFPERRLDPFRTWEAFVATQLAQACDGGFLKADVDITSTVWTVVAAGMGTIDLLAFHDAWDQAPAWMEAVIRNIVALVRTSADEALDVEAKGR